ncbi:MAG: hypothetical protein IPM35_33515 [Myxococcales bacterium]|nr:hypothetical protein [Myxococcales bacterium]
MVDLAKEIVWARARYPDDLARVSFESLAERLVAWAPQTGEIDAYLSDEGSACRKIVLSRPEPPEPEEESPSVVVLDTGVDPEYAHTLDGKVDLKETRKGKVRQRSFQRAQFGHYFETTHDGDTQLFEGGRWVQAPGARASTGEPNEYRGTLSEVDGEVAVFGGVPVTAVVKCAGPMQQLACTSGGTRKCDSCQRSRIEIDESAPGTRRVSPAIDFGVRVAVAGECREPCPKLEPPDRARIASLFASTLAWATQQADRRTPAIYRSRKRCLAERAKYKRPAGP